MTALTTALKAKDIMVPEPVCVEPSTTLRQLARVFEENDISGAPVIDHQGRVIGVVSKTDLLRRTAEGSLDISPAYLFEAIGEQGGEDEDILPEAVVTVEDFMTEDPVTVSPDTPAGEVARQMCEGRFHRVVVVDDGGFPLGIITSLDLLGTIAS